MAWDDEEEQKKKKPVYNQGQQEAYKRMQEGFKGPPVFDKLKDLFGIKKKKKEESEE